MPDKENFNCVIETKIHPTCDEVHEFIADNNADAPHQQDLLQAADGVARTIACGTHAAGSHLTKTVINYGTHYIVRRLTPTECARLQGFPDAWGHPDIKETLSDEEYAFWLNVRNTHAEINGKATKEYTREQMLTWYNKLHTDSAEYKLWGNGIALPCALYVMQGIAEVLHEPRN
jgi:DNA (cytosine-5)-methyltransferase 1